jgi:hypothetical protein
MIKMPRTLNLPQGPLDQVPPATSYDCLRTPTPLRVDGRLDEEVWQRVAWSAPFVKMDTGAPVSLDSRIALLWDDAYLYAGYRFEDHEIWGTHVEHHDHVYHNDSDAEIFVQGDGVYYELGVNPINTIYEVFWTWLAPVVERRDVELLNRFFSTEDFFYFLPRLDEPFGRIGEKEWELPGLKHAVQVDGSLNCPEIVDRGWTVEFALPWEGLRALGNPNIPPKPGDVWRIGASRCQHFHDRDGNNLSVDWSWNRHGYINMHIPERWTYVRFVDEEA